jgi:uncharacterized repeat protein (TIGR03806 family)
MVLVFRTGIHISSVIMKYRIIIPACFAAAAILLASAIQREKPPAEKLSDYGLFTGKLADLVPADDLVPYTLNTPLFTDYAEKLRFLRIPPGTVIPYNDSSVFDFPAGTVLVKNFFYPKDFRDPSRGREIIETRLLVRDEKGWKALPYVWNKEQTEAYLDVAGETRQVKYTDVAGKSRQHAYYIPNMNQCKGCHNRYETMAPIGPSARQLNGEMIYGGKTMNQLAYWASRGMISGMPDREQLPVGVKWDDPRTGSLDQRARAWLDINCGHCHRPGGPASTSGLYLTVHEKDPLRLGIGKAPVAAGRGSGDLQVSIMPGQPEKSILLYRMASTDPGVMMPELGRSLAHGEGIALIRQWIREMKPLN